MQKKLEALIAKIAAAEKFVRDGKRVDMHSLDEESRVIARELKAKPDATVKPLLSQAVLAIERLTHALEDHVAKLKDKKK